MNVVTCFLKAGCHEKVSYCPLNVVGAMKNLLFARNTCFPTDFILPNDMQTLFQIINNSELNIKKTPII